MKEIAKKLGCILSIKPTGPWKSFRPKLWTQRRTRPTYESRFALLRGWTVTRPMNSRVLDGLAEWGVCLVSLSMKTRVFFFLNENENLPNESIDPLHAWNWKFSCHTIYLIISKILIWERIYSVQKENVGVVLREKKKKKVWKRWETTTGDTHSIEITLGLVDSIHFHL